MIVANNKIEVGKKLKWFCLIFFVAMVLRFSLALINREANDDHVGVVALMISTNGIPQKSDCWSCYQPKLYYLVCAGVIKALGVEEMYARIKVMQLLNVFFSFFILYIFWKFIDSTALNNLKKLLSFALFALNPCLLAINIQSTNDTLAIFFGVSVVYALRLLVEKEMKLKFLMLLVIALIGGCLTKASIIVLFPIAVLGFVGKWFFTNVKGEKMKAAKFVVIIIVSFMTIVPYFGGYYNNYKQYKSFTLSTWEKDKPPLFFEKTWVVRSGLRSIFEGYFYFRYFDMIRQPYINNEWNNYPIHRTSLWSQLYGRTMFLHFDQWPPGWQNTQNFIVNIGRVLILLGIVPLMLFLTGIFLNTGQIIAKLQDDELLYFARPMNYLFLLITITYLIASMFYSYNYRDFSAMKSIYIFPAMIAFIKMFCDGYLFFGGKTLSQLINVSLLVIILFSIVDVGFLLFQLS